MNRRATVQILKRAKEKNREQGVGKIYAGLFGGGRLRCLAAIVFFLAIVGCDYVRRGSQRVEIVVTRLASGHPVANAVDTCAPTKRQGPSTLYDLSVERYLDGFREESQVTDSAGRAVFPLHVSTMRGGLFVWLWLDAVELEDAITGETYFFRIEEGARETVPVRMIPGQSVKGERFVLSLDAIGPPKPE